MNQHDAAIDIGEIIQIVINVASCLAEQLTEDIGSIDWQCRIDGRVGGKLFACEYHFFGMVFQCGQRFGFGIGDDGERFDNAFKGVLGCGRKVLYSLGLSLFLECQFNAREFFSIR